MYSMPVGQGGMTPANAARKGTATLDMPAQMDTLLNSFSTALNSSRPVLIVASVSVWSPHPAERCQLRNCPSLLHRPTTLLGTSTAQKEARSRAKLDPKDRSCLLWYSRAFCTIRSWCPL